MACSFLVLLVASVCAVSVAEIRSNYQNGPAREMQKRSSPRLFEYITSKARLLYKNQLSGEEVYIRKGGLTQARIDFYAAKPENVRSLTVGTGKEGTKGDQLIKLYRRDERLSMSAELVVQPKGGNSPSLKIIYED